MSLALAALALLGAPALRADPSVAAGAPDRGHNRVRARLVADVATVQRGVPFQAGVLFDLDPHWHIYWKNPGATGLPTRLTWRSPEVEHAALRWPAPERIPDASEELITYGYSGQVLLWGQALASASPARGPVTLAVGVDLLACNDQACIPAKLDLRLDLPTGPAPVPAAPPQRELFARFERRLPAAPSAHGLELEVVSSASAVRPGDELRVALGVVGCRLPPAAGHRCPPVTIAAQDLAEAFIPDRIPTISLRPIASRPHPTAYAGVVLELAGRASSAPAPADQQTLAGVLFLRRTDDTPAATVSGLPGTSAAGKAQADRPPAERLALWIEAPLVRAGPQTQVEAVTHPLLASPPADPARSAGSPASPATGAPPPWPLTLAGMLLLALVGGLILNLMPCVLPVLAIKAYRLTSLAHQDRRQRVLHAAGYTAGIVASMLALAAVVIALKAGGEGVGWGFQFQHPAYVSAVAAVMVAFALNMFGVFEISIAAPRALGAAAGALAGQTQAGLATSLAEGVLTVILATPCSTPFLATAVGFALAAGPLEVGLAFTAIGIGLALPFGAIALVPGLGRLLPRPGEWMLRFRQLLGFALLGTVIWLLWITGRVEGVGGMTRVLAFLLVVALAAWVFGSSQRGESSAMVRLAWALLASVVLLIGGYITLGGRSEQPEAPRIVWREFDRQAVARSVADGNVALVVFTADWCLTCKANEAAVIDSRAVTEALELYAVHAYKADWTSKDEAIRAELARFGKAGVPMYLVYSPAAPERPELLPELLTIDIVLAAIEKARA